MVLRVERALNIHSPHLQFLPARDSNSQPLDYESDSLTIRPLHATCTVYLSLSATRDSRDKCREIVRLTEKILELEARIQTVVEDSKNVRAVDMALDATSSGSPVHCSVPVTEPVQQGNWVTVIPFPPRQFQCWFGARA